MRTVRYLVIGMALVAGLLLVGPLASIDGRHIPLVIGFPQAVAESSSTDAQTPGAHLSLGETDDEAADNTVETPPPSHTTRVGRWRSSPLSGPSHNPPVANFGIVESGMIYRSAQPTEGELRWLQGHGFKSIVSFRRETGDRTERMRNLGFKNALWLDIEDETNPTDEQAEQFLDFVTDEQNWPVLIHCKVGLGRTGTMAALVRYAVDGWSMEEAISEAKLYRGGVDLVQSQMDWLSHWASVHPTACHRPIAPPVSTIQ